MTKIISVNAGSSSLKFQLFEMPQETVLTSGVFERIGLEEGIFTIKVNGEKKVIKEPIPDHTKAVSMLLDALVNNKIVEHLTFYLADAQTAGIDLQSRSVVAENNPTHQEDEQCATRDIRDMLLLNTFLFL